MPKRITTQHLQDIAPTLSKRDGKILSAVRQCRYLTTKQIQRLYFTEAVNETAGRKATNKNMNKLKNLELVNTLARRIGGVRAGSGAHIWYLTDAGERLLRLDSNTARPRKRFFEPSQHFLKHTLAVAECHIQLTEICSKRGLELVTVEMEPDCWRQYNHKSKFATLRPDLFAVTNCDAYEDRWFFELDLSTEAPVTVVEKCRRYHDYYRGGLEQKQHGVFPLVVWIVPDDARKESITQHIRAEFAKQPKIFIVITPEELGQLIRQSVDGGALC